MGMYDLIKYGRYRMTRPLIDLQELYSPQSVYGFPWDYLVLFLLRNPILPRGPHGTNGRSSRIARIVEEDIVDFEW